MDTSKNLKYKQPPLICYLTEYFTVPIDVAGQSYRLSVATAQWLLQLQELDESVTQLTNSIKPAVMQLLSS